MLSLKNKFLFIHAPKTAGNSIQNILRKYSEDTVVIKHKSPDKSYLDRFEVKSNFLSTKKHSTINEYYRNWNPQLGKFEDFFKFSVVRNPWERAISYYFWKGFKDYDKKLFIKTRLKKPCMHYLRLNEDMYPHVDFIIRFEKLQKDFNRVCKLINLEKESLPFANQSKHLPYMEYYDDETKEIIQNDHAEDIKAFGYSFEK